MTTTSHSAGGHTARRAIRTGTGLFLLAGLIGVVPATDYGRFLPIFDAAAAEAGTVALIGALTVATVFGIWERAVLPALATLVLAATFALNTGLVWPANLALLFTDCAIVAVLVMLSVEAESRVPVPRPFPERRFDIPRPAAGPRFRPDAETARKAAPRKTLAPAAPRPAANGNAALALRPAPLEADNLFRDDFHG